MHLDPKDVTERERERERGEREILTDRDKFVFGKGFLFLTCFGEIIRHYICLWNNEDNESISLSRVETCELSQGDTKTT